MKKLFLLLTTLALGTPVMADHIPGHIKEWNSYDSMGCMLLQECTDDVRQITSLKDIVDNYPGTDFDNVAGEVESLLSALDEVGVNVFLGNEKYFPPNHRGVYHTISNNFFLNEDYVGDPRVLLSVMRHEGWHAAQDCMAGTIENNFIAIIKPESEVPFYWRELAERTYPANAVPWEAEAWWAGKTQDMTVDALKACATGAMWEIYEPTPLTRKFLEDKGYIK